MDRVRDDLFADPALSRDQHGSIGPRDAADQFVDILHRRGTPDDEIVGRLWRNDRVGLRPVLRRPHLLRRLQGALGDLTELKIDRLPAQHVEGPQTHRLDHRIGRVNEPVENHHRIRVRHADALQQFNPVNGAEVEFRDEEVGTTLRKKLQGLVRGSGRQNFDRIGLQMLGRPIEEIRIIIRDNDRLFLGIFHIGLNLSAQRLDTVFVYAAGGWMIAQSRIFSEI